MLKKPKPTLDFLKEEEENHIQTVSHIISCRPSMFFKTILANGLVGSALTLASPSIKKRADVDSYITTESPIAYQGVLNNIGPNGTSASGASAGIVVASPSKVNPDCEFVLSVVIADSKLGLTLRIKTFTRGPVIQA